MSLTLEKIKEYNSKIPEHVFKNGVNKNSPFCFLDFEVFKHDWLICFSTDGVNIKHIINDPVQLKKLFLKLHDRIHIAYNGNNYDKLIALGLLNDLNPKEINDNIINNFNFNFNMTYGNLIREGRELMWYDPSSRLGGSLKTYEACEGENIYESEVDFNLDRKLTQEEIDETKKYCSFDVEKLIQYFYKENFDSFLGHVGLIDQTLQARPWLDFSVCLPKTDASLVGTYLCTEKKDDPTKDTDVIQLPDNIMLGKYENQIKEFLEIPIKTLKKGIYNSLNAWSLKTIEKSINRCTDETFLNKLKNKEEKALNKIKKLKTNVIEFKNKSVLTDKQQEKLEKTTEDIKVAVSELNEIRIAIDTENKLLHQLQTLKIKLDEHKCLDFCNPLYNEILAKIVDIAYETNSPSTTSKKTLLIDYLNSSLQKLFDLKYTLNKKETPFNSILIECSFEVILNIKGIPHLFKTGGIHSVAGKSLFFDKSTEHDKNRRLLIADVGSLYPNLMRVFGLCSIGMDNPQQFAQMIFDRIELKKKKDPFANVLKLILNTTYGCMGSVYNNLYDPTNRLKVCIFGQCTIVDLLDKLEDQVPGLEIFQSNTDGIIISCEDHEYDNVERIIHEWESRTGLEMEIEECLYLAQRDVSNYILIEK